MLLERGIHSPKAERLRNDVSPFQAPLIIGLGQTGRLYAESFLQTDTQTQAFIHSEHSDQMARTIPGLTTVRNLKLALAGKDLIVVATPGQSVSRVLKEIKQNLPDQESKLTVMFSANGIGYIPDAREIFRDKDNITVVRASLFTPVDGVVYDRNKLRIGLSLVSGSYDQLQRLEALYQRSGFVTAEFDNPEHLEVLKAFYNSIGTTSIITGLTPRDTFKHPMLARLEEIGVRDRLIIIKQAGYPLIDLPWSSANSAKQMAMLSHIPQSLQTIVRPIMARKIADERHNLKPAVRRQLEEGNMDPLELLIIPQSFITLSRKENVHHTSPVDEAIYEIASNSSNREEALLLSDLESRIRSLVLNVRNKSNVLG